MAKKFTDVFDDEIREDEIRESKKPAGCIGGIFQLFDCQQLLGGKQLSEQGNRRDSSGHAPKSPSSASCNLEKNRSRRSQENPRYSMESSRTSFSSTFTSFSSLEHKSPQEEQIYPQYSGSSPRNSPRTNRTDNNKSPAFKEIIKESIYRDLCSTPMKEDDNKRNKVMKPIHSPGPMDSSKVNHLVESPRIVFKLNDSPCSFYEEGHSPRISFDGTEISHAFINVKQFGKHGGLSRLSLDSKETSLKCNLSPKFSSAMKECDKNGNKRVLASLNQLKDLENNEKNSSIIAKLMGLEPLNSDAQSSIRCYDPFNEPKNQIVDHERKHEKPLHSPRNIARSPRNNNPNLDLPCKFSIEKTPLMAPRFVERNMNQKIQSVLSKVEERLQKLQCHHSSKELWDLKRALLETKKNGKKKLNSVNSLNTQLTAPNKPSISERVLKSPIVIMEPAKKLDVSFSKVTKLEGRSGLGKIRTSNSKSNRKNDYLDTQTNAGQSFTEKKAKCRGTNPLSKEQNERAVNNTVSPRLQHMKSGLKIKASAAIPTYDSSKSPRLAVNSELLDSVFPRSKLKNKQNKVQEIKLQNSGEQVNVEATSAKNSSELRSPLFKQSIQSSVKVDTEIALASEAKKYAVTLKDLSAMELNLVSAPQSCLNYVPDALLDQNGLLHSPVSVSKVKDYQNLLSDSNFTMKCPLPTISSTVSSRTNSDILKSKKTTIQGSRNLGKTINEASVTNATIFTLENQDQDSVIVAETFLVHSLLQKESDLLSMLEHITSNKPSEFVQKSNPQKLHRKLIFDVVNEILAQKMDVSSSSIKLLYKELCSEIRYLRSCKQGNLDDNSRNHKNVLCHSQAWDGFESEIPALALEIERLIFKDLINEVVNGVTPVVLDAKQRHQKQMFAKHGI